MLFAAGFVPLAPAVAAEVLALVNWSSLQVFGTWELLAFCELTAVCKFLGTFAKLLGLRIMSLICSGCRDACHLFVSYLGARLLGKR